MSGARKAVAQLEQPPAHVRLHRAQRTAKVRGELGVREAVEEGERDRLALLGIELAQAAHQGVGAFMRLGIARGRGRLVHQLGGEGVVHVRQLARAPHEVEAAVAHDRGHPGRGGALRSRVVRGVVPDADKAVLQCFLRERPLADYTQRNRTQFRARGAVEVGEGRMVAHRRAGDQLREPLLCRVGHGIVRGVPMFAGL